MHERAHEETVTSLHDLSAVDLIAGFRAKQFSPSEVLEDVLAHVAIWEPHIKALYAFDPDAARVAAEASSERWRKGEAIGLLDGVPVTIKENIATQGVPVPLGAATTMLVPAAADAPPAARLREAGALIFSKTTMPDYGMLSSGLSSFHPLTRNPWDLSKNPGGSSAGADARCRSLARCLCPAVLYRGCWFAHRQSCSSPGKTLKCRQAQSYKLGSRISA